MEPKKFSLAEALSPIWSGDTVYKESVMYLEGEEAAQLLYRPTEILSVTSSDWETVYQRGRDWELDDEGRLVRLPGSAIPAIPLDFYYPAEHTDGRDFGCTVEGHPYLAYGENDTFSKDQIAVTYRHNDTWSGSLPKSRHTAFRRFFEKLQKGEEATILFFGDSITTGCNSTGTFGKAPFTPSYTRMITDQIAKQYGYTVSYEVDPHIDPASAPAPLHGDHVLHYINTAVGGMDSAWGLKTAEENVNAYSPDLLILAFGMNDGWKPAEDFLDLTRQTVDCVRAAHLETEVCLVATMLPHWRAAGFFGHQKDYEAALQAYAEKETGMAVAPVTSVHNALLARKEFYTMTGNNINHSNDFMARIYAMTILATLLP